ncbi:MAG: hypothetical protein JRD49_10625 [Deltaproteobacteria bacterium]|nr:hypothetical protein [Deltaproteobacteria bacterium]MBW2678010.1 hypothetical protein [Deltaproteobacteria bacterium]
MLIRKKVLWLTVTCLLALCFNSTGAAENTGTLIVDITGKNLAGAGYLR